ncbi:hypothetical protein DITRI_Ditri04bG0136300 [Diplodiscus trichospermus]
MEKKRSISSYQKNESYNVWDCGSPLYDSYELASLGHILERHTMALPYARSMQLKVVSDKPKPEGRFQEKTANLRGIGLLRIVVMMWTLCKMRIKRDRNEKRKRL